MKYLASLLRGAFYREDSTSRIQSNENNKEINGVPQALLQQYVKGVNRPPPDQRQGYSVLNSSAAKW